MAELEDRVFYEEASIMRGYLEGKGELKGGCSVAEPTDFFQSLMVGCTHLVVTRALAGAGVLDRHVEKYFTAWTIDEKHAFTGCLAGLLKSVHGQGMVHGDLKAKNILVAADRGRGEQICFIDLDATRLRPAAPLSEKHPDLARLNCSFLDTAPGSRTHRLFFLQCYVEGDPQAGLQDAGKTVLEFSWRKLLKSGREFRS